MRCFGSYRGVSFLIEVLQGLLVACPYLLKRLNRGLVSGISGERAMSLLYDMFFASAKRHDLSDTLRNVLGALPALWRYLPQNVVSVELSISGVSRGISISSERA
jgi:hypothetical protein